MKCADILKPSVAVALAVGYFALFLAPCCLAAAIDSVSGLPQQLLVPFNDLLPPLSDAEFEKAKIVSKTTKPTVTKTATTTTAPKSTTTTTSTTEALTTTTTKARPPATSAPLKPIKAATAQQLKKTQYQLQQHQQQQRLSVPALNLNPEVPPPLLEAQVKVTEPKPAASTQHLQHVKAAQTQYQSLQQHLQPQKLQQQKQQFTKQLLQESRIQQKLQPQATAATIAEVASTPQQAPQAQQQVNNEQLKQYLEYIYHPTTRRPSRGALPTLTPFPRRVK